MTKISQNTGGERLGLNWTQEEKRGEGFKRKLGTVIPSFA